MMVLEFWTFKEEHISIEKAMYILTNSTMLLSYENLAYKMCGHNTFHALAHINSQEMAVSQSHTKTYSYFWKLCETSLPLSVAVDQTYCGDL